MAIKTDFEFQGHIFPKAYIKIRRITLINDDIENYVDKDDNTKVLVWETKCENLAKAYVYADEEARRNNVMPIQIIGIEFDYDGDYLGANVYSAAYAALKNLERFKDTIIEDV